MSVQTKSRDDSQADPVAQGEKLGFYEVLSGGPVTAAELARQASVPEALARSWLASQSQEGYVVHDIATDRYSNFCSFPRAAQGPAASNWR